MEIINKFDMGPVILRPTVFKDSRGYFCETFNEEWFKENVADTVFVQDNQSCSQYGTLRGLHFQQPPYAQAKLVRVTKGAVYDVAVDIRKGSPTYGQYCAAYLSEENHFQFYIPRGFAHGFLALKDNTVFQYKCDNLYHPESEGGVLWCDKDISIPWGCFIDQSSLKLSTRDMARIPLSEIANGFVYEDKEEEKVEKTDE